MSSYQQSHDLPVYKTCREFRKQVSFVVSNSFPGSEEYMLRSQVLRSSRSATANIAEGFGRFYHQENIQCYRQAEDL
jgi:four helix bundle protein